MQRGDELRAARMLSTGDRVSPIVLLRSGADQQLQQLCTDRADHGRLSAAVTILGQPADHHGADLSAAEPGSAAESARKPLDAAERQARVSADFDTGSPDARAD